MIGFGRDAGFSSHNDDFKKFFELRKQGYAMISCAFLPLCVGDNSQAIAGGQRLQDLDGFWERDSLVFDQRPIVDFPLFKACSVRFKTELLINGLPDSQSGKIGALVRRFTNFALLL